MLEHLEREYKIITINILKVLLEKVDIIHEQIENSSRDMEEREREREQVQISILKDDDLEFSILTQENKSKIQKAEVNT